MAARNSKIGKDQMERMQSARKEGVAVRAYLAAKSGTPALEQSEDAKKLKLEAIDEKIATSGVLDRIKLLQQRYNVENNVIEKVVDITDYENAFIKHVKAYSERNGIVHEVWLEAGIDEEILKKAGI